MAREKWSKCCAFVAVWKSSLQQKWNPFPNILRLSMLDKSHLWHFQPFCKTCKTWYQGVHTRLCGHLDGIHHNLRNRVFQFFIWFLFGDTSRLKKSAWKKLSKCYIFIKNMTFSKNGLRYTIKKKIDDTGSCKVEWFLALGFLGIDNNATKYDQCLHVTFSTVR